MFEIEDKNEINFSNVNSNKTRKKNKKHNSYGLCTTLVKKYQSTRDKEDLLEVLNSLEGVINTYTILLTPGEINQSVYLTSYMKKFLGMFLTKEERVSTDYNTFNKGIQRIRWIMRSSSYEDIYSKIVEVLIHIVSSMKIIGNCDCIFYIQLMVKYKMYDMIIKTAKDATVNIVAIENLLSDSGEDDNVDSTLDKLYFQSSDIDFEEEIINNCFYNDINISILIETRDLYKKFNNYEKYLIFLRNGLNMSLRQILTILMYENLESIENMFNSIDNKLKQISEEHLHV